MELRSQPAVSTEVTHFLLTCHLPGKTETPAEWKLLH